jgi:nucleoside-diphosphate-sugar epimerase
MNSVKDKVALSPDAVDVIFGASGTTGSIIVDSLLSKGKKVSVVGRDLERLQRFVRQGAEAFTYVSDAAALTKAFSGARAAYLMSPPPKSREDQERESDAMAKAVTESGLRYAVHLLEQLRRAGSRRDRANRGAAFFGAKTERDQRFERSAPARCVFHGEQSGGD